MPDKTKVFVDTSALFSGIWSAAGGARMILKLGEAGAISLLVSIQVLQESERALRRKAPDSLASLALLLDRTSMSVVPAASAETVTKCQALIRHAGDALILAATWESGADYLVALDRKHILDNAALRTVSPFAIGTPGDFLAWYREHLVLPL